MEAQPPHAAPRQWTFMVYLAGDNNLESFGVHDLQELRAAAASPEVAVAAQFDAMSDRATRRYVIHQGADLAGDLAAELPETNTGDPKNLVDFIAWAAARCPAQHYALVLWNHGSGWKDEVIYQAAQRRDLAAGAGEPAGGSLALAQARGVTGGRRARSLFRYSLEQLLLEAVNRAILFDDASADFLDNQELSQALQAGAAHLGQPFDLLGFDACLMNMLEVACQVQGCCRVMVGSQEVEPGEGWPYQSILTGLAQAPESSAEDLGRQIVAHYAGYYRQAFPGGGVTQSAIRLAAIPELCGRVHRLGGSLLAGLGEGAVRDALFQAMRAAQTFRDLDYLDLAHLCRLLAEPPARRASAAAAAPSPGLAAASQAAQAVLEGLSGAGSPILAEAHQGAELAEAHGLSIYLPTRAYSPLYERLAFAQAGAWPEFLQVWVNPRKRKALQ